MISVLSPSDVSGQGRSYYQFYNVRTVLGLGLGVTRLRLIMSIFHVFENWYPEAKFIFHEREKKNRKTPLPSNYMQV